MSINHTLTTSFPDAERGFLFHHRGPFKFLVERPHKSKVGQFTSEWLAGEVDADTVEEEANALLTDPRDTIVVVGVYSVREGMFVNLMKRPQEVELA